MAAESPRRGSRGPGMFVRPQPVNDKSVMESVVDFFQDVAYNSGQRQTDDREKIQWIRFEDADLNDVNANPDCGAHSGNIAPLLLVLGYTNGVQVWSIAANGEAQEVLSLRQGPVRTLCLLKTPTPVVPDRVDLYANKRPLIALCDASSAGQPYCCVKFVSLRAGDEVHNVSFSHPVSDIKANERVLIVAFPERIAAFDACQFKQTFWITSCYPSPGSDPNPIALGDRWLAYSDRKLIPVHQSGGGMAGDGAQSYAATVISAAKTITKGLTMFGETVASSLTGVKSHSSKKESSAQTKGDMQPGIVTVIDILNIGEGQISVQEDSEGEGLVAHFPAHTSEPISAMAFDPSGMMLLTADKLGHNFHLFRIMAHPWSCSLGAVHHLYTLHRGDTTAEIQNISFTMDSRWVAVSTLRGTTHVFPVTPYGGAVSIRTHSSARVVNRASRFHRSAGIEDMEPRAAGRHSPIPTNSGSPGSSPGRQEHYRNVLYQNSMNNNMGNPRLPPYPHPTTVHPVVQVRQTISIPGMPSTGSGSGKSKATGPTSPKDDTFCVAACFARSRGWVAGSPMASKDKTDDKYVDSLYICNWMGSLVEYVLEPRPKTGPEKITDDSPLDCEESGRAQWILTRCSTSGELKPPLTSNNPLIIGNDAVVYQRPSSSDLLSSQGLMCRQESKESLSSDHSGSGPSGADSDDQWLSQVEIITHAGPHRRLWMGPQFSFKTFQGSSTTTVLSSNSSVLLSHSPEQTPTTMDIVSDELDLQSLKFSPHPVHESKQQKRMPKISHKEKRIAAFEECLKDWNPRPEMPEEPPEELPDWLDDLDGPGPRVAQSVQKLHSVEKARNVKPVIPVTVTRAVKINSKAWSEQKKVSDPKKFSESRQIPEPGVISDLRKVSELKKVSDSGKFSKPREVFEPNNFAPSPRQYAKTKCEQAKEPVPILTNRPSKHSEPVPDVGRKVQMSKLKTRKPESSFQETASSECKVEEVIKIENSSQKKLKAQGKSKKETKCPMVCDVPPPVDEYFSESTDRKVKSSQGKYTSPKAGTKNNEDNSSDKKTSQKTENLAELQNLVDTVNAVETDKDSKFSSSEVKSEEMTKYVTVATGLKSKKKKRGKKESSPEVQTKPEEKMMDVGVPKKLEEPTLDDEASMVKTEELIEMIEDAVTEDKKPVDDGNIIDAKTEFITIESIASEAMSTEIGELVIKSDGPESNWEVTPRKGKKNKQLIDSAAICAEVEQVTTDEIVTETVIEVMDSEQEIKNNDKKSKKLVGNEETHKKGKKNKKLPKDDMFSAEVESVGTDCTRAELEAASFSPASEETQKKGKTSKKSSDSATTSTEVELMDSGFTALEEAVNEAVNSEPVKEEKKKKGKKSKTVTENDIIVTDTGAESTALVEAVMEVFNPELIGEEKNKTKTSKKTAECAVICNEVESTNREDTIAEAIAEVTDPELAWEDAQKKGKKGKKKRGGSREPEMIPQTDRKLESKTTEAKSFTEHKRESKAESRNFVPRDAEKSAVTDSEDEKKAGGRSRGENPNKIKPTDENNDVADEAKNQADIMKRGEDETITTIGSEKNTQISSNKAAAVVESVRLPPPPKVNPWGKPSHSTKLFNQEKVDLKTDLSEKVHETESKEESPKKEGKKGEDNKRSGCKNKEFNVGAETEKSMAEPEDEVESVTVEDKAGGWGNFEDDNVDAAAVKTDENTVNVEYTAECEAGEITQSKESSVEREAEPKADSPPATACSSGAKSNPAADAWSDSGKKGKKKRKGKNKNGNNSSSGATEGGSTAGAPKRATALEKHQERSG